LTVGLVFPFLTICLLSQCTQFITLEAKHHDCYSDHDLTEQCRFSESSETNPDLLRLTSVGLATFYSIFSPMTAVLDVEKKKLDKPPLDLHFLGDRVLRQPAKRIAKIDEGIRQLARDMLKTMYSASGIGLAAPQVAVNKQLIVIDVEPNKPEIPALILINPQITGYSSKICTFEEGCLSVPNIYLDVHRPEAIEVTYKDEWGKPQKLKADGLLARVIQHEMDHLQGVMFVDRVENALALNEALKKEGFSTHTVRPIGKS
jgi:peptide deformylase